MQNPEKNTFGYAEHWISGETQIGKFCEFVPEDSNESQTMPPDFLLQRQEQRQCSLRDKAVNIDFRELLFSANRQHELRFVIVKF